MFKPDFEFHRIRWILWNTDKYNRNIINMFYESLISNVHFSFAFFRELFVFRSYCRTFFLVSFSVKNIQSNDFGKLMKSLRFGSLII